VHVSHEPSGAEGCSASMKSSSSSKSLYCSLETRLLPLFPGSACPPTITLFSTFHSAAPVCDHPVRSLPLKSGRPCGAGARAESVGDVAAKDATIAARQTRLIRALTRDKGDVKTNVMSITSMVPGW